MLTLEETLILILGRCAPPAAPACGTNDDGFAVVFDVVSGTPTECRPNVLWAIRCPQALRHRVRRTTRTISCDLVSSVQRANLAVDHFHQRTLTDLFPARKSPQVVLPTPQVVLNAKEAPANLSLSWSGRGDSNSRRLPWQADWNPSPTRAI